MEIKGGAVRNDGAAVGSVADESREVVLRRSERTRHGGPPLPPTLAGVEWIFLGGAGEADECQGGRANSWKPVSHFLTLVQNCEVWKVETNVRCPRGGSRFTMTCF